MGDTRLNTTFAFVPKKEEGESDTAYFEKASKEAAKATEDSDTCLAEKLKKEFRELAESGRDLKAGEITTRNRHLKYEIIKDSNGSFQVYFRDRTPENNKIQNLVEMLALYQVQSAIESKSPRYAHDFINLLTAVFGNIQLLEANNSFSEEDKKHISTAYEAIDRAKDLCMSIMNAAKPDEKVLTSIDVVKSIDSTLRLLNYDEERVEIKTNYAENLPKIEGYKQQVLYLFYNVLLNAYESIDGKGKIRISAEDYINPEKLSYESVKISIEDNGCGMDDKMLEIWRSPKNQDYISKKQQGNGIGRIIVLTAVKNHNIAYSVQSRQGQGTKFSFYFKKHIEEPKEEDPMLTLGKF